MAQKSHHLRMVGAKRTNPVRAADVDETSSLLPGARSPLSVTPGPN